MDKQRFLTGIHPMDDWGNHKILLWLAMNALPKGDVIEFGCGDGSTRQMHELCEHQDRMLYSFDTEQYWLDRFAHLKSDKHLFRRIENNWEVVQDICPNPAVMLMDHAPGERRRVDIKNYSDKNIGIIVIHDTQPRPTSADYGYGSIWNLFKYRVNLEVDKHHSGDNRTWASAVSNNFDVTKWVGYETGYADYRITTFNPSHKY